MTVFIIIGSSVVAGVFVYLLHLGLKAENSRISNECDAMFRTTARDKFEGYNFNPDTAILLSKSDTRSNLSKNPIISETNRIYKTSDGRYFLYIGTNIEPGVLTPLSEQRTKNALRSNRRAFSREFPGEKY